MIVMQSWKDISYGKNDNNKKSDHRSIFHRSSPRVGSGWRQRLLPRRRQPARRCPRWVRHRPCQHRPRPRRGPPSISLSPSTSPSPSSSPICCLKSLSWMEFVVQGGEPVVLSGHEATQAEVRIKIVDGDWLSRREGGGTWALNFEEDAMYILQNIPSRRFSKKRRSTWWSVTRSATPERWDRIQMSGWMRCSSNRS